MVGWLVNYEMVSIWKEAVVALFWVIWLHFSGWTEKKLVKTLSDCRRSPD